MAKTQGVNEEMAQAGADFLNAYAGQGMEGIDQSVVSMAYLSISQDLSDVVTGRLMDAGVFYNSATQTSLGTEVRVIPVAFKKVWDERDQGGKTVARYEPGMVEYTEQPVPTGKRGFPRKISKDGNEIIETFAYALVLPDHPEAGFLMHTAGIGSMKAYRRWNTQLGQMRLASGDQAPIYGKIWTLRAESRLSKTVQKNFYAMAEAVDSGWIANDEFFAKTIKPSADAANQLLLAAPAPSAGGDIAED
jgi:hypothetical protein